MKPELPMDPKVAHKKHLENFKLKIQRGLKVDPHNLFPFILKNFTLEETLKLFPLEHIKEKILPNLSIQTIFDDLAIPLVKKDKAKELEFLIKDLGYIQLLTMTTKGKNNLLHKACQHDSLNVAKLLMSFQIDRYARDDTGSIPTHHLFTNMLLRNDTKLLDLLNEKSLVNKKTMNTPNNSSITPLELGTFVTDEIKGPLAEMVKSLVDKIIKTLVKNKIFTLNEINKTKKSCRLSNIVNILESTDDDIFTQVKAAYYKAIFFSKNNKQLQNALIEVKTLLKEGDVPEFVKWSESLNKYEIIHLQIAIFNSYYLSTTLPPSIDSLKKKINEFKKSYLKDEEAIILILLEVIECRRKDGIYDEKWLDYLEGLITEINKDKCIVQTKFSYLNQLGRLYLDAGLYAKAIAILKPCSKQKKEIDNNLLSEIYYNLSIAQRQISDYWGWPKSIYLAFECSPTNSKIFLGYVSILWQAKQYDTVLEICNDNKIYYPELTNIIETKTQFLLGKISENKLLNILLNTKYQSEEAKSIAHSVIANFYAKNNNNEQDKDEAIKYALKSYKLNIKNQNILIAEAIAAVLMTYVTCKRFNEALPFIEENMHAYPREFEKNDDLKIFSCICYIISNQFEKAEYYFQKMIESGTKSANLLPLFQTCIWYLLSSPNIDKKMGASIIDKLSILNPINPDVEALRVFFNALHNDQEPTIVKHIDEDLILEIAKANNFLIEEPEIKEDSQKPTEEVVKTNILPVEKPEITLQPEQKLPVPETKENKEDSKKSTEEVIKTNILSVEKPEITLQPERKLLVPETKENKEDSKKSTEEVVKTNILPVEKPEITLQPEQKLPVPETKENKEDEKNLKEQKEQPLKISPSFYKKLNKDKLREYAQDNKEKTSNKPSSLAQWYINGKLYREGENGMKQIESTFWPNHFILIDETIKNSLPPKDLRKFEGAMDNYARKEFKASGIKDGDSCIEVKATGKGRIYTNKKYKNPDGKYLIILDDLDTNKKSIARKEKKGKEFKIINVESNPPQEKKCNKKNNPKKTKDNKGTDFTYKAPFTYDVNKITHNPNEHQYNKDNLEQIIEGFKENVIPNKKVFTTSNINNINIGNFNFSPKITNNKESKVPDIINNDVNRNI